MESLDLSLISVIISFIGHMQYRFVAGINKSFRRAHRQLFPGDEETRLNASTLALAKLYFEELNVTAKRSLQYLRSMNSERNDVVCSYAALNGHLHILQ